MGIIFQELGNAGKVNFDYMNLEVRDKTTVWIVCRREGPVEYHLQGVACATEDKSAEEVAVEMCRDENYYIFPFVLNVSLPHKAVLVKGLYFPLKKDDDS